MVILVVLVMFFLGALAVGTVVLLAATAMKARTDLRDRDRIAATLFNGRPQVVYSRSLGAGLTDDVLLAEAATRGYRLTSRSDDRGHVSLVFDRTA